MDVFKVHEQVIADYRAFTSGFVEVRGERIKAFVDQQFADGVQWPDPWLSLNPSFACADARSGTLASSARSAWCLTGFDTTTQAARTGVPYRSLLHPPPGEGPRHPEPTS